MGEEKKDEENHNAGEEQKDVAAAAAKVEDEKKEEEKKDDVEEPQEIVLKVDMHCVACARKVARALKGFQGVDEVKADYKASKVVVKGKEADPVKVSERIHKKTGRKVQIVSPLPKPVVENKEQDKEEPPKEEKKEEAPAVITVVLQIRMHCGPCAHLLQKRIGKIKGVELVTTDIANDLVTVKGIVDPDKLVSDVYRRTGKHASIVKDEEKKDEEKKEDEKKKNDEKEEGKKGDDESKKEGGDGDGDGDDDEDDDKKTDLKKNEYWQTKYNMDIYDYPQMFSDDNPNACSLM